ncbi:site-specific integrase [Bacillus sp. CLL-7-23]|uniref:Site-specific integrase n=1 Tax=Bacillus changyiensis TaxID=3004103 RepID=A0ABT4X8G2_9BACI|nr:site-specific integrase [Bacillus changyiensis]MDA7028578.1 site-specific integrase [Bacillus changyiensis]
MATFKKEKAKRSKNGYTWYFVMDIGIDPRTGKRKQLKRRGFATKAEAEKACRELMNKLSKGLDIEKENILFKEVQALWYKEYKQTVKVSTLRARKSEIDHLLNYFGDIKLKKISRAVYQEFLDHLRDNGYSYNTISGIHTTAGMIFNYARQEDLIIKSPTEFAKPQSPKLTVEELEALDEIENFLEGDELVEFLDLTEKHGLFLDFEYFCMSAFTGCRAGERLAGKWKDLCLEDGEPKVFKITKTLYCPKNKATEYYLLPPKTPAAVREVPLSNFLAALLKRLKIKQAKIAYANGRKFSDDDFIFARPDGNPGNIKKMDTRMRRILKRMNIKKKITQHTFRHTFTSLAAEAGVPLEEIQKILGHENDEVTKKVYLHTTKKSKEKTSQQFNSFVNELSVKIQFS